MGGKSDQEKAAERQYQQVSRFNPNIQNRFNLKLPYSPQDMMHKFDMAGKAGVKDLKQQTDTNVKQAQKSTAAGGQSRGLGGSILEDAIAKSRAKAAEGGTSQINKFLTNRLAMLPGLMGAGNRQQLAQWQGATGVDLGNVSNMFNKFGSQMGAIGGLSDDTWLDDVLAVGNTVGTIGSAFV